MANRIIGFRAPEENVKKSASTGTCKNAGAATSITWKKPARGKYGTRILAKNFEVSEDTFSSGLNGNDIVCASPGAGKTGGYVAPNILTCDHSMVIADTKGLLIKKYGPYLKKKGFKVVCLDFVHPERSEKYNFLDQIRREIKWEKKKDGNLQEIVKYSQQDIRELVKLLIADGKDEDPFWEEAARTVLTAIIAYVIEEAPGREQNMESVILVFEAMSAAFASSDEGKFNGISFFEELGKTKPNSFAYRTYKRFVNTFKAERTWASIAQFVSNGIDIFSFDELAPFTKSRSSIDLNELGRKKTALFVNVSDNKRMMDPLVNVFYTQLFQILMSQADENTDGRLEVPVRIFLDDFATNVFIPDFDKIVSTIRSRQITVSIILQDVSQLDGRYPGGLAKTILAGCDHKIFIGSQELDSAKYITEFADCTVESVLTLPRGKAWLLERGSKPVLCDAVEPYSMDKCLEK